MYIQQRYGSSGRCSSSRVAHYCFVGALALLWDNGDSPKMATESIPVEVPVVDDELELVANARKGDAASFSILLRRYEGKIFRLAMNITQNREDAEDVLQEAFLKAYEHLDQFQGNSKILHVDCADRGQSGADEAAQAPERSGGFARRADRHRRRYRGPRDCRVGSGSRTADSRRRNCTRILTGAIDELAPIYRTVFTLRDVDGLSTEETAEALDLTVPAVKSRLLRARLQLRDKLTRFFKRKGDDAFAYM